MIEKSIFTAPNDPNIHIWRYMDFTKFVSMLQKGGLIFSRADKLGDPFEGFYPKGTELAKESTRNIAADHLDNLQYLILRTSIESELNYADNM